MKVRFVLWILAVRVRKRRVNQAVGASPYHNTKSKKSQSRSAFSPAFTIVELLIVVVVIAILAAITIVSYNGITSRANDTAVQSDFAHIARKMEIYKINNGVFPGATTAMLTDALDGFSLSRSAYAEAPLISRNVTYCRSYSTHSYALTALSKSGKTWIITGDDPAPRQHEDRYPDGSEMTSGEWCSRVLPGRDTYNFQGYVNPDWRTWTGHS